MNYRGDSNPDRKQKPGSGGSLLARFEYIAGAHGDRTAVLEASSSTNSPARSYSYAELNQRRLEIAAALQSQHGLEPGDRVGLMQSRRFETIAAMLAIASAGASYVPMDRELPEQRLRFLMADSAVKLLLSAAREQTHEALPVADLAHEAGPLDEVDPASPLYVMYTSGSTGRPKGVVVPHGAVHRLVVGTDFMKLDRQTRFLHFAPQSFDAATLEIWGPLLNGGTCVLCPDGVVDPGSLDALVIENKINALWLTAALFNQVVMQGPAGFRQLKTLLFGGERASVVHVRQAAKLWPDTQLINGYGPTENTTFTCCHTVRDQDIAEQSGGIPIGRAISGTTVRVVDDTLADVAHGTVGELLAGGKGLAIEYLKQAELTAARFIRDATGERWYRTGDLVREDENGVLHFHGRADRQLKVHGHRIEPGEVEAVLLSDGELKSAHVLAAKTPGGDQKLVAYLVGVFDRAALLQRLNLALPRYLVPSVFVGLDELPTTKNGKVDVEALPDPFDAGEAGPSAVSGDAMTQLVATTWQNVVSGIDLQGHDDNFFDVGGTSMDMVLVKQALEEKLARKISLVTLFQYPTVAKLADHLGTLDDRGSGRDSAMDRAARRRQQLAQRKARQTRKRH